MKKKDKRDPSRQLEEEDKEMSRKLKSIVCFVCECVCVCGGTLLIFLIFKMIIFFCGKKLLEK